MITKDIFPLRQNSGTKTIEKLNWLTQKKLRSQWIVINQGSTV